MNFIGIDVGTTMIKGQLLNEKGLVLFKSSYDSPSYSKDGVSFISCTQSEEIVLNIIKELVEHSTDEVGYICFSSFGEAFALIDKNGKPANDFILFVSNLGEEQVQQVRAKMSDEEISSIVGCRPDRMFSFSKLMWIKENHPEIYNKTDKFLMVAQYMVYVLTGKVVCDYTCGSRSMCLDIRNKTWSKKVIDACGLDLRIFPDLVPTDSIVGNVTKKVADLTGLSTNCKVLASGHDQVMAAVGSGICKSGMANDGIGTAECLTVCFDNIPEKYDFYKNNLCVVPYILDGLYVTYAFITTGGALLNWFKKYLCPIEAAQLKAEGQNLYTYYNAKEVKIPTNLFVLPHFDSTGTPYLDSESSGCILGLNQYTTKEEIYFALMEGASYEIKANLSILSKNGIKISSISATGGGAKSVEWLTIKANIYGRNIRTLSSPEGGIFGCFILCLKKLHPEMSYEELMKKFIRTKKVIKKDRELVNLYKNKFIKYRRIYSETKKIWR